MPPALPFARPGFFRRIKNKFLFSVLAVFSLIFLATLGVAYRNIKQNLLEAARQEALGTTQVLATTLYRNYELENDSRQIQSFVLGMAKSNDYLLAIVVVDRDRTIIGSTNEAALLTQAEGPAFSAALANQTHIGLQDRAWPPFYRVVHPVSFGSSPEHRPTGALEIRFNLTHLYSEFANIRLYTAVACLAILLGIGMAITLISQSITRPIHTLFDGMQRVNDGDLDIQVTPSSRDEIGYLTTTFNSMVRSVALANRRLLQMVDSSRRFVPAPFLNALGKADITAVELGDATHRDMTVFFLDIRGFTEMSSRMSAQQTLSFLNEMLGFLLPAIERHGGFIDKYIGDAVMALFPSRPDDAVEAAIELRRGLETYNRARRARLLDPVDVGIGLNYGELILGTLGAPDRLETTVIGSTVNIASRLEHLTKDLGVPIILPSPMYATLEEETRRRLRTRDLGKTEIRGVPHPIGLTAILGPRPPATERNEE